MNAHHQNWNWLHDLRTHFVRMVFLATLAIGAHADWQWSDQVDTLGPTGSESPFAFPQVGVDPISGIATAAWIDTTTFMNEKVQAVRFINGQWGTPETISQKLEPVGPGNTGPTLIPVRGLAAQVAPGKNGDATVAWTSLLPDQYALSGNQWKKAKARWSDPAFTPMENIGLGDPPQIRIGKDQNGITTAVWRGNAPDGTHLIQSSRFTNDRWGKPKTLFQGGNLSEPQIAVATNGVVMVVWTVYKDENNAPLMSRFFKGGKWTPTTKISLDTPGIVNASPSIISPNKNSFIVVWSQYYHESSQVLIREYIKGKWFDIPRGLVEMKGKNLYYPAVASTDNGMHTTVVYSVKGTSSDGSLMHAIMASTRDFNKYGVGSWADPMYIGLSYLKLSIPQVAMDGEGNSTVVWEVLDALSGPWLVRATRHSPDAWTYKQIALCVNCSNPSLAVDKAGNAWVVWVADGQVQSKRGATVPAQ